ncbi:MAG: sulfurtransferase [Planctomycetota bacterium]
MSEFLVQQSELRSLMGDPNVVLVDCAHAASSYARAHIPGAVLRPGHSYVKGDSSEGLFLPQPDEVAALAEAMGIGEDSAVICYDAGGGKFAARLWWVLKYYGHNNVRLLNGGWQGWVGTGEPVSTKAVTPNEDIKTFEPTANTQRVTTQADLIDHYEDWTVLDTRSNAEFRGTESRKNKRTGHVPGAMHVEWNQFLNETDGVQRMKSPDEIRSMLEGHNVALNGKPCVTY